jgi:hypothetical protein
MAKQWLAPRLTMLAAAAGSGLWKGDAGHRLRDPCESFMPSGFRKRLSRIRHLGRDLPAMLH